MLNHGEGTVEDTARLLIQGEMDRSKDAAWIP